MTKRFRPVCKNIGIFKSANHKSKSKDFGDKKREGRENCMAVGSAMIYSISIRDGQGIDLGLIPDSSLVLYIISIAKDYAISIEMAGVKSHFQILLKSEVDINVIRKEILKIYRERWSAEQIKYACKVTPHNSEEILLNYVCKQKMSLVNECVYNPYYTSYSKKQIEYARSYAGNKEVDDSFLTYI